MAISTLNSESVTPEEEALGHFTRKKLQTLPNWRDWNEAEHKQLNQFHKQRMFGDPIDPITLPKDAIILRPHWQYSVKRSGVRRSRLCCNGSKYAAPQLHEMVSTWSSCVETPIQRLFLGLCAHECLKIYGCDIKDAYAHSPAPMIDTYLTVDNAYSSWYREKFNKSINPRHVLPVKHSLQGHPKSGKMYMKMINKILLQNLGFVSTTHDRCIYKKKINGKLVLVLRQVDDILIACKEEKFARDLTNQIGTLISFKEELEDQDLPIDYFGLVEDFNGVDIDQYSDRIKISCRSYIKRFLQTHGWGPGSDEKNDERDDRDSSLTIQDRPMFTDSMKSSKPNTPLTSDSAEQMFKQEGPIEHSPEAEVLQRRCGFSYRTVLGELMYACVTARPDTGYAVTTLSKFSTHPSAYHYKQLRNVAKYL